MPRGIPGSGPNAGRGKGRKTKTHTLADIAARSSNGQQAGNAQQTATGSAAPATAPPPAAASTGRGRGGKGRAKGTTKTNARRGTGTRGQRAGNGQQRADQAGATGKTGANGGTEVVTTNGVEITVMAVPGRGGRPQQSEAFPFAALDISEKTGDAIVGPSFLIPDDQKPDNVLAAARKRHKGKTFTARKMQGGVRIWRLT